MLGTSEWLANGLQRVHACPAGVERRGDSPSFILLGMQCNPMEASSGRPQAPILPPLSALAILDRERGPCGDGQRMIKLKTGRVPATVPQLARPHEPAERPAQELADWAVAGERARMRLSEAGLAIGGERCLPSRPWFATASGARLGPCIGTEQCLGRGRVCRRGETTSPAAARKRSTRPGAGQFPGFACYASRRQPSLAGRPPWVSLWG